MCTTKIIDLGEVVNDEIIIDVISLAQVIFPEETAYRYQERTWIKLTVIYRTNDNLLWRFNNKASCFVIHEKG